VCAKSVRRSCLYLVLRSARHIGLGQSGLLSAPKPRKPPRWLITRHDPPMTCSQVERDPMNAQQQRVNSNRNIQVSTTRKLESQSFITPTQRPHTNFCDCEDPRRRSTIRILHRAMLTRHAYPNKDTSLIALLAGYAERNGRMF
jgi:hypothetical protein